jgi:peptide/nickel transport system ATP-binding protein
VLEAKNLTVEFPDGGGKTFQAVSGVNFRVFEGETLGLVGESGCGKSPVAKAVAGLLRPASGKVVFRGENLAALGKKRLRKLRPKFQMIFQDSTAALNPRRSVGESIAVPLTLNGAGLGRAERDRRVRELMAAVGLDPETRHRRPFRLSGGQCQRVQIARALASEPDLLVCDEPTSSLDVSVQAQILNLLKDIGKRRPLAMLFISHDLAAVKNVSDRIAVMHMGKICETAPCEKLLQSPVHPCTKALLAAVVDSERGLRENASRW